MRTTLFVLSGFGDDLTVSMGCPEASALLDVVSRVGNVEVGLIAGCCCCCCCCCRDMRKGFPDMVRIKNDALFYVHEEGAWVQRTVAELECC